MADKDGTPAQQSSRRVLSKSKPRRSQTLKKRPHLAQLRVSTPASRSTTQLPYAFSELGSFTEGDIHINKNGLSIKKAPKSPQVEDTITQDQLEIFEDNILGQGASGIVKLGKYIPQQRIVAIKKVPLNLEPGIRKKVLTELRTLYQCNHTNIVSFYGGFLQDGAVNLVLEYMDGGTLAECLKTRGRIPEFIVGKMAAYILPALAYIHKELHIVHRDIKPSNILLNSGGVIKLSDFGVSGKLANTIGIATTFAGTLTYMSPERIQGGAHSTNSDIWSFGLSLLECALGHFPFLAPDEDKNDIPFFELLHRIQNRPVVLPDDYSREFESFIALCLKKDPDERQAAYELVLHPWVQKYSRDSPIHFCRWVHQTLRMQNREFQCSAEDCGECSGSYIASIPPGETPRNFFYGTM